MERVEICRSSAVKFARFREVRAVRHERHVRRVTRPRALRIVKVVRAEIVSKLVSDSADRYAGFGRFVLAAFNESGVARHRDVHVVKPYSRARSVVSVRGERYL